MGRRGTGFFRCYTERLPDGLRTTWFCLWRVIPLDNSILQRSPPGQYPGGEYCAPFKYVPIYGRTVSRGLPPGQHKTENPVLKVNRDLRNKN